MNKVDILDEAPRRLKAAAETFGKVRAGLNAVIFGQLVSKRRVERIYWGNAHRA